jgi:hypothetical protein
MKKVVIALTTIIALAITQNLIAQSPLQVSIGNDQTVCYGSYTELNAYVAGGIPPYTYKWTPTEELSSANASMVISTPTFTTTYRLLVTDSKGAIARDEVKVEVAQRPSIRTNGFLSIEPNEKVKLEAKVSGGNGTVTYSWKPASGLDNASSSSPTAKPTMSTTYTVMVRDSKGCTATEQVSVNVSTGASASRN